MFKRITISTLILITSAFCQYDRPGSSSAQFLKIGVSPRATAMADAFISLTDGAEATHYNPAALVKIKNIDAVFTHTAWFAGINHEFAAVSKNFGPTGTFAVSMTALYTDLMEVRTPLRPEGTGETFFSGNYRCGLSYARYLTDHVSIGINLNYIQIDLYKQFSESAVSGDIAVLYFNNPRDFSFAMKISNFGSDLSFVYEQYPLPLNFSFGLSMNAIESDNYKFITSLNAVAPNDGPPLLRSGFEWRYIDLLSFRIGYHLTHKVMNYTFGGGISIPIEKYTFIADYSFNSFHILGGVHSFGLRLRF